MAWHSDPIRVRGVFNSNSSISLQNKALTPQSIVLYCIVHNPAIEKDDDALQHVLAN
jgi:hypothetical protein